MTPRKIAYIDPEPPSPHGGGIRTYLQLMVDWCGRHNLKASVYTHNLHAYPQGVGRPFGRKALPYPGVRKALYAWAYSAVISLEISHWLADALSKEEPGTVVEFADYGGYGFFPLGNPSFSLPHCLRIHTPLFLIHRPALWDWSTRIVHYMERQCLRRARHLVTPSDRFRREHLPACGSAHYLPNPLPRLKGETLAVPTGESLLYVGRVEERKGVRVLVEAFLRLADKRPELTLQLAGGWPDSSYAKNLKALVHRAPEDMRRRIVIHGELSKEKLQALLNEGPICVFPSLFENAPYAFFEALRNGNLCVVSRTGEMGEMASQNIALVSDPGDSHSLEHALEKAWDQRKAWDDRRAQRQKFLENREMEVEKWYSEYYGMLSG